MRALRDALEDLPEAVFADLLESSDAYLLVVDVPGATADRTEVQARDRHLHVAVDREGGPPAGYEYRRRGRQQRLSWDLPLPPDVDPASATASVERGVLELELPRVGGETAIPIE